LKYRVFIKSDLPTWEINIVNNAACCKLSSDVYELSKHVSHVSSHALYICHKYDSKADLGKKSLFFFWSTSLIKNTISSHKTACRTKYISKVGKCFPIKAEMWSDRLAKKERIEPSEKNFVQGVKTFENICKIKIRSNLQFFKFITNFLLTFLYNEFTPNYLRW
jgi:hypothetical protein